MKAQATVDMSGSSEFPSVVQRGGMNLLLFGFDSFNRRVKDMLIQIYSW